MKLFYIVILASLSAWLYRRGGTSKGTKWRDLGCPVVTLSILWFLGGMGQGIAFLLKLGLFLGAFLLMFGFLTTYWDFITGKDNFYLAGAGIGLAILPLIWCGISWYAILGRAVFLALSFGLINKYVNKWLIPHSDEVEEYSRGFLLIATLPILLI